MWSFFESDLLLSLVFFASTVVIRGNFKKYTAQKNSVGIVIVKFSYSAHFLLISCFLSQGGYFFLVRIIWTNLRLVMVSLWKILLLSEILLSLNLSKNKEMVKEKEKREGKVR